MLGHPKFKKNDKVKFKIGGNVLNGVIEIVDAFGTVDQNKQVSYDIFVESENCLYKHIVESIVEADTEE